MCQVHRFQIGPEAGICRHAFAASRLSKVKPVSDQVFQAYRSLYSYDKTPLNAAVEAGRSDEDDWKIEKDHLRRAYGNERAISYLFLPKKGKPPYQTVLFFPGSSALPE